MPEGLSRCACMWNKHRGGGQATCNGSYKSMIMQELNASPESAAKVRYKTGDFEPCVVCTLATPIPEVGGARKS